MHTFSYNTVNSPSLASLARYKMQDSSCTDLAFLQLKWLFSCIIFLHVMFDSCTRSHVPFLVVLAISCKTCKTGSGPVMQRVLIRGVAFRGWISITLHLFRGIAVVKILTLCFLFLQRDMSILTFDSVLYSAALTSV